MGCMNFGSWAIILLFTASAMGSGTWVTANGPYADLVKRVVISKSGNPYLSTDSGGFASFDNCATWVRLQAGDMNGCLAEKADGRLIASAGFRVYRSDQTGRTWTVLADEKVLLSEVISISTIGGEMLVAAGKEIDTTFMGGSIRYLQGFYYSEDGGVTWKAVAGIPLQTTLGTNSEYTLRPGNGWVFFKKPAGLYRTNNVKSACEKLTPPIPSDSAYCFTTTKSGTVYWGGTGKLYKSTNGCDSWSAIPISEKSLTITALCELSADTLLVGSDDGVFRNARGDSTLLPSDLGAVRVYDIAAMPNGSLLAGSITGIHRSNDRGVTWTQAGVIRMEGATCLARGRGDTMYAGTERGVYRSADNGDHWSSISRGLVNTRLRPLYSSPRSIQAIAVDPLGRVFMFAPYSYYRFESDKKEWKAVYSQSSNIPASVVFDTRGNIFLGTSAGIWRSENGGNSFICVGSAEKAVECLLADHNGRLFAALNGEPAVYRSTDTGGSWQRVALPQSMVPDYACAVAPDNTLYMTVPPTQLIVSTDNGGSWSVVPIKDSVGCLMHLETDAAGVLYSRVQFAFVTSADGGKNWTRIWNSREPGRGVAYDAVFNSRNDMFLATWPDGLLQFKSPTEVRFAHHAIGNDQNHEAMDSPERRMANGIYLIDLLGRKIATSAGNIFPDAPHRQLSAASGAYVRCCRRGKNVSMKGAQEYILCNRPSRRIEQ